MSGPESGSFDEFWRDFNADEQRLADAEMDALGMQLEQAGAEQTVLGSLDWRAFTEDVQADLSYMTTYLSENPGAMLTSLFSRYIRLAAQLRIEPEPIVPPEKIEAWITIANQKATRIEIVINAATILPPDSPMTKAELQAEIFAYPDLPYQEKMIWAAEMDNLLDGDSIDYRDPKAVDEAVAAHQRALATEDAAGLERQIIRLALEDELDALYALHNIPLHEDLPRYTREIATAVAWDPDDDDGEPNLWKSDLLEYRARATTMDWTVEKFDMFVAGLYAYKRRLKEARGD